MDSYNYKLICIQLFSTSNTQQLDQFKYRWFKPMVCIYIYTYLFRISIIKLYIVLISRLENHLILRMLDFKHCPAMSKIYLLIIS